MAETREGGGYRAVLERLRVDLAEMADEVPRAVEAAIERCVRNLPGDQQRRDELLVSAVELRATLRQARELMDELVRGVARGRRW